MKSENWIGVGFDGVLAAHAGSIWPSAGAPNNRLVDFISDLLRRGVDVRVFTGRASAEDDELDRLVAPVHSFCEEHFGRVLPVTCCKDMNAAYLIDDAAVHPSDLDALMADPVVAEWGSSEALRCES